QHEQPARGREEERAVAPAGGAGRRVRSGAAALAEGGRRGDERGGAGVQGRGRRPAGGQGAADRQGAPQSRRPRRDEGGRREGQGGRVEVEAEGGRETADAELVLRCRRQGAVRRVLRVRAAEVNSENRSWECRRWRPPASSSVRSRRTTPRRSSRSTPIRR